jgi:hypothetical protein
MKIVRKCIQYSTLFSISVVLAIFLLALTTNVSVYQSADEIQTLGVKTWSGLPVPYKATAGMSLVEFCWWRMSASMLILFTVVFTGLRCLDKKHNTNRLT